MKAPASAARNGLRMTTASSYFGENDEQTTFDMAVVIPTIGRPSLAAALESIFSQDIDGRVQVLVGFDIGGALPDFLTPVLRSRPVNFSVLFLHLPYSTSERRGGFIHHGMGEASARSSATPRTAAT